MKPFDKFHPVLYDCMMENNPADSPSDSDSNLTHEGLDLNIVVRFKMLMRKNGPGVFSDTWENKKIANSYFRSNLNHWAS